MRDKIKELYINGYSIKEISFNIGKSQDAVKKFIQRNLKEYKMVHKERLIVRQELIKKEAKDKIKELYINGHNAKEIADILNLTHQYIRVKIMEDLKEYKSEHIKTRALNKEIIKSVDSMNNSYIGNSSLLNWNRQSYKYNKNGNLVFNEEDRGTKPLDLPRAYYRNKENGHLRKDDKIANMLPPF